MPERRTVERRRAKARAGGVTEAGELVQRGVPGESERSVPVTQRK